MDEKQQKLKNAIKNVVLLVLFVGMLVLLSMTWMTDLSLDNIPSDSLVAKIYQRFTYGVSGFEIRTGADPAAQPTRIAVSLEGELVGAQYQSATVSTLYVSLQEEMGQALANCGDFDPCTEEDFCQALQGEVLYFGYEGYLPVSLLSSWMGSRAENSDKADALLLTADGELYLHVADGYRVASTSADPSDWEKAMENFSAASCRFAVQDKTLTGVRPDTLLLEQEDMRAEQFAVQAPQLLDSQSGSNWTALFDAFQYDPHVSTYPEDQGNTQVYAENYSTLHISVDGTVQFRATAMEGGMEVYNTAETARADTLRLQVDFAYTLLKNVQGSISDSTQAMLYDITQADDNVCVLTFIQLVNGIPVETDSTQPFARFEFRENKLMAATIHLQQFQSTGVQTPVLSSTLAAAAAPGEGARLAVVYQIEEQQATARRCYVK
ncbi:MAG: hypothetical protein Q3Y08_06430 [Butyricicoccus sp.]|nr:hypothetical protein [Butyricicoccus sp.]